MVKTKKRPVIIVPHGARRRIAKHCGVSEETVRRALKFITESEEAVKIRKEALENYGGTQAEIEIRI